MNNHQSTSSNSEMLWQMRAIGEVVKAIAQGDFTQKVSLQTPAGATWDAKPLEIAKALNGLVDHLNRFSGEATRISHDIGVRGLFGVQMEVEGEAGAWKELSEGINLMARNLTDQVRDLALVITSIAMGDMSRKITVDTRGEFAELGATINVMADQLNSFASQVTRLTRELGTESRLGGQIAVKGASGVWHEMTENFNTMSADVTTQIRAIGMVLTYVADGELDIRLVLEGEGEFAAVKNTFNGMSEMLSVFASQVTRLTREMGVEGKLGGQLEVPGASGSWKEMMDNLNTMSASLTTQVRSLNDAARAALSDEDASRRITVEAKGEIKELRDNLNALLAQSTATP